MAAVEYDPYLGDGASIAPHLPSTENLGGTAKENDPDEPPDPVTMPDAHDHNAMAWVMAALARVAPAIIVSVDFSSGAPFVYGLTSVNVDVDSGDLSLTDNGTGDTTVEYAADTFPIVTGVRPHGLTLNDSTAVERTSAVPVSNGVRVRTLDGAGSGVDCAFTVTIQGQ
jgi:hypothetical protein